MPIVGKRGGRNEKNVGGFLEAFKRHLSGRAFERSVQFRAIKPLPDVSGYTSPGGNVTRKERFEQLERMLGSLTMENDILKNADGIYTAQPRKENRCRSPARTLAALIGAAKSWVTQHRLHRPSSAW